MTVEPILPARQKIEDIAFSVSARVAMQLGRESISNSIIAIIELIKNAYDADAEDVWVSFSGLGTEEANLIIEDNGNGMTFQQVKDNWMVIGTDNKAQRQRSRRDRIFVGEKGLGRLGLDRLARLTKMRTFSESQPEKGTELEISWEKYEQRSSDPIDSIRHELYLIPKTKAKGTTLIMEGLKDNWIPYDLESLRKDLSLLVSPFSNIESDFRIWLKSNIQGGLDIDTGYELIGSSDLLDVADWKVMASIEPATTGDGWVIRRKLIDPEGRESTTSVAWRNREGLSECKCGPLDFEMYFFPRGEVKTSDGRTLFSRSQVIEFLESHQGIRIYRDGFRVQPYGNPDMPGEADWLGLNPRRVRHPSGVVQKGRWRVAYNQVVGAVFISKDANSNLIDQTNREGLVEGAGLTDLRTFALNVVDYFEERRQAYERSRHQQSPFEDASQKAADATEEAVKKAQQVQMAIAELLLLKNYDEAEIEPIRTYISSFIDATDNSDKALKDMKLAYDEREKAFEEKETTLANLASLGILAAVFGHETLGQTNLVANNLSLLADLLEEAPPRLEDTEEQILDCVTRTQTGALRIQTFAKFTIGAVRSDKRHHKLINIDRIAKDVIDAFELSTRQIAVEVSIPNEAIPQIRGFRIDWESIFLNLLTNAVWALEGTEGKRRAIRVQFWVENQQLNITFDDGGRGIEPGTIDRIFEPTFSTRRNSRGDVVGTGMGLSIVENLINDDYKGTINVHSHGELGGAQFHIAIPLERGLNRK